MHAHSVAAQGTFLPLIIPHLLSRPSLLTLNDILYHFTVVHFDLFPISLPQPTKSTSLGNIEYLTRNTRLGSVTATADDTTSLGSYNSDTANNNNNSNAPSSSVYHSLVSAMASTKVSHYDVDDLGDDNDLDDITTEDHEDTNNNPPQHHPHPIHSLHRPPPLRPKSSASQHAPERTWYETSLDKVGTGSKVTLATKAGAHKPPALLPRELVHPQLHIDIPGGGGGQHPSHHQQLERSMSHRIVGSVNFVATAISPQATPPPITRQHHGSVQHQEETMHSPGMMTGGGGLPMSPHKKLSSSTSYPSSGNNNSNSTGGPANNVRRGQSNVPIMASSTAASLLSPRSMLSAGTINSNSNNNNGPLSPCPGVEEEESVQVESPMNMTVVQQGKFQPYKEESKPFEMSDFYKYSTKFRQQATTPASGNKGEQQQQHQQTHQGVSGASRGRLGSSSSGSRNADENSSYRGNVLYQQEQQQQRVYADPADVTNNNNNCSSSNGRGGNNHNNSNGHILHPKSNNNSNVPGYGSGQSGASNAQGAAPGNGGQYPISYQQ